MFFVEKRDIVDIEAGPNRLYSQGNVRQMEKYKIFQKERNVWLWFTKKLVDSQMKLIL